MYTLDQIRSVQHDVDVACGNPGELPWFFDAQHLEQINDLNRDHAIEHIYNTLDLSFDKFYTSTAKQELFLTLAARRIYDCLDFVN